eukprot:NODE_920_length_1310_cov_224.054183.p1 GENE.NODE_920_length_1310_cov_224.054183~~NODE_920_length_1310_cov_224.054183.p1  ORF type:complete len:373 (+),score=82.86 NODE_920_length_1310_cov_224.054183:108-1226(+)
MVSCDEQREALARQSAKPYLRQLHCDPFDAASVCRVAVAICPALLQPGQDVDSLEVTTVTGGHTNQLRRVMAPDGSAVLLRVFGAGGLVDRDVETSTFEALADWLGRPAYLGRFANGRVEEWLHGYRHMTLKEIAVPLFAKRIAEQVARLHQCQLPPHLAPFHKQSSAPLWETARGWLSQAFAPGLREQLAGFSEANVPLLADPALDAALVGRALEALEARVGTGGRLAFCHNDLCSTNVMLNVATGDVRLIDLEYGSINYAAFDIAEHFMEHCGGISDETKVMGVPEYDRLPGGAEKRAFCEAYLAARDGAVCEADVEAFVAEVALHEAVDNIYWGLWGIAQARHEKEPDFPYLLYGKTRLGRGLSDGGFL